MYYKQRNKSSSYSIKLYNRLNIELDKLLSHPELGVKTKFEKIRGLIISNYVLYYEISEEYITVLKVWDSRQNPDKLVLK